MSSQPNLASIPKPQVLSVTGLRLHHFRNYESLEIEAAGKNIVLTGANGAGKTNLLEAISLLVPGRGLRKAQLAEIDRQPGSQPWVVSATVNGMQGECQLGTGHEEAGGYNDKRLVKIDGDMSRSQAELARHISMLWLTPQMEQLFNQGTSESRRFLDRLVYSFDADHASRINAYDYAMRERNRLLQDTYDPHWLDTLEQTMAESGTAIAQARLDTLASLNHAISLSDSPFPKAHIEVDGTVETLLQTGMTALAAEHRFKELLQESRRQDAAAARSLLGTHRSLLKVTHLEKQLPAEACSTGEQKILLLSIVLAQAKAAALWKQVVPILLLDDVSAHLDSIRRQQLFDEIGEIGAQVWMTGTEVDFFSKLRGKALFFHVDNARLFSS